MVSPSSPRHTACALLARWSASSKLRVAVLRAVWVWVCGRPPPPRHSTPNGNQQSAASRVAYTQQLKIRSYSCIDNFDRRVIWGSLCIAVLGYFPVFYTASRVRLLNPFAFPSRVISKMTEVRYEPARAL